MNFAICFHSWNISPVNTEAFLSCFVICIAFSNAAGICVLYLVNSIPLLTQPHVQSLLHMPYVWLQNSLSKPICTKSWFCMGHLDNEAVCQLNCGT